jgi:hypothetical protein
VIRRPSLVLAAGLVAGLATLAGGSVAAGAEGACRIAAKAAAELRTAPNGTPLGTLANGTAVEIVLSDAVEGGPIWALVARDKAAVVVGWVPRAAVRCD